MQQEQFSRLENQDLKNMEGSTKTLCRPSSIFDIPPKPTNLLINTWFFEATRFQNEQIPRELPPSNFFKDTSLCSFIISPATVEFLDSFVPLPGTCSTDFAKLVKPSLTQYQITPNTDSFLWNLVNTTKNQLKFHGSRY